MEETKIRRPKIKISLNTSTRKAKRKKNIYIFIDLIIVSGLASIGYLRLFSPSAYISIFIVITIFYGVTTIVEILILLKRHFDGVRI